jgi:hypothetical protein
MQIKNIEYVSPLEDENPLDGNLDVWAELEDGNKYSFLVATPNNIYWSMENEGTDYFFGVPPVFVKQLTAENIERALNALVAEADSKLFAIYAAKQK